MRFKPIEDEMAFYAAYHRTQGNKAIHFLFVPLIVWSAMGLLALLGTWTISNIGLTIAHVLAFALLGYYLWLDYRLGIAMVVLFTFLLVTAIQVAELPGTVGSVSKGLAIHGTVFAVSWVAQLLGHRFIEHRKPALADNLWQVFVAPIFVVAEWAFAFGLRKKLHDDVMARIPE